MLHVFVVGADQETFSSFVSSLSTRDDFRVADVARNAIQTAEAMRSGAADALLFPDEWSDAVRSIKSSVRDTTDIPLVVTAAPLSKPILARSLAYGFNGAVSPLDPIDVSIQRIQDIVSGSWHLEDEPSIRDLGLANGLFDRDLVIEEEDDRHIADLVGVGLTDEEIARVIDKPLQHTRNRIEHLLFSNDLTHRTQLAVIRASLTTATGLL